MLLLTFLPLSLSGQEIWAGFSIGNGFNNKRVGELQGEDFRIKGSSLAWKLQGSVNWGFLGVEGGYRQFGEVQTIAQNGVGSSKTRGGDIFGKGIYNIGFFHVFGKAGVFFSRTRNVLSEFDQNNTLVPVKDDLVRQAAFAWGFGGGIKIWRLQFRIEYENLEINPDNLGMLSFGILFGVLE